MKIAPFDASKYLDSEETIAEFLSAILESGDQTALLLALGDVAKARGMTKIAADSGLNRESLYRAFSAGANPGFDTVRRVMEAVGVRLVVVPIDHGRTAAE